jgi:hypothetical protein
MNSDQSSQAAYLCLSHGTPSPPAPACGISQTFQKLRGTRKIFFEQISNYRQGCIHNMKHHSKVDVEQEMLLICLSFRFQRKILTLPCNVSADQLHSLRLPEIDVSKRFSKIVVKFLRKVLHSSLL